MRTSATRKICTFVQKAERMSGNASSNSCRSKNACLTSSQPADETTTMLHGADAARQARATAERAFEQGGLATGLPTVELPRDEVIGMMVAALATRAGLTPSNSEARRLAQGGGLRLNDEALGDAGRRIAADDVVEGVIKLGAGRKKIVLVKPA